MPIEEQRNPSSPGPDGEGVRVIRVIRPGGYRRWIVIAAVVAVSLIVKIVFFSQLPVMPADSVSRSGTAVVKPEETESAASRPLAELSKLPRGMRRSAPLPAAEPAADVQEPISTDPNDLATYVRPGDPEPTMGEVIAALNDAGSHSGLGAFNPPGTSPPMDGLGVPEDFPLPEGYVRHHQVTDQGEPIEAILMFSPDFDFYDEEGRPVLIPENRVVPPELVPPGIPVHVVTVPKP
ncbi:MAG: hypothetical protein IPK97_14935 [Ahniella sp.]|nr:hypothetical protein [Ahniella sp.]